MAPSKTGKTATTPTVKKEKVYHPSSRKAGQLARHALRKGKLGNLATKRGQKHDSLVDFYGFFYHALPETGALTLEELHHIIGDVWLTRFDEELEGEKESRRKGRPKSAKEMKLEDLKLREAEQYRTGMEVIDITHPANVELFRRWDQKEVAFIQQLRFIRIFSSEPDVVVLSRLGKHTSLLEGAKSKQNESMDIVEEGTPAPTLIPLPESPARFSSTTMAMDEQIST